MYIYVEIDVLIMMKIYHKFKSSDLLTNVVHSTC